MSFEKDFAQWLEDGIAQGVSDEVVAFCFNLNEPAFESPAKFGVELIGAGSFDEADPDWPCDEVWEPEPRMVIIPPDFSGPEWEECLARMKALVSRQLELDGPAAKQLKSSQGIGIGFVDGELEIVWTSSEAGAC